MKIEDNFLDQEKFNKLQNVIMGENMPWSYTDGIVAPSWHPLGEKGKFQFCHVFYREDFPSKTFTLDYARTTRIPNVPSITILEPILNRINSISIWRIKTNLLTRTSNIIENAFHIDMFSNMSEEKLKQWTTSIFYVNTNNGYTEFEDGTKVESVANRFVSFPANLKHRGTSCTDENTRIVINFNYFEL